MSIYPAVVLPFGLLGVYVGVENLLLFAMRRRRHHLWVGLLGLSTGPYAFTAYGIYTSKDLVTGSRWQTWELLFASGLVYMLGMLGFDFIGQFKRVPVIGLTLATALNCALLWIPGAGFTNEPAIKVLPWLGVTYWEMALGPSSQIYFGVTVLVLGWIVVAAARRAWHASWPERMFVLVLLIWFVAAANDTAVAMGIYKSVYVSEFAFSLMAALFATLLFGEMHRSEQRTEAKSKELTREALVRDGQLAAVQAELTEAAKMAVVGRLAAGVAHEVNNPLSYVINNLIMLCDELPGSGDASDMAKDALEGAKRIKKVVGQLSAYARPSDSSGSGNVRAAVDIATRLGSFELKDRAEVEVDVPEHLTVALGQERLAQVLLNLLVNAAQSIAPGRKTDNYVRLRASEHGDRVIMTVEDSGPGIPAAVLCDIFDPFFTTKPLGQGTGLGLSISKEIVTRAGGKIWAENVEPHGARFGIELPAGCEAENTSPEPGPEAARPTGAAAADHPNALVVDDDAEVLRSLDRMLSHQFEVKLARNGDEAREILSQGDTFHFILCDLMMPQGSGLDLLDWICDTRPEIASKVILMTGGGLERQAIARAHRAHPRLLAKPFTLDELSALLAVPAGS
jgi:signal transduction histidine kinase